MHRSIVHTVHLECHASPRIEVVAEDTPRCGVADSCMNTTFRLRFAIPSAALHSLEPHVRNLKTVSSQSLGVRVNPVTFVLGGNATGGEEVVEEGTATTEVCLFPLLSWYHASWDDEPDLPPGVLPAVNLTTCSQSSNTRNDCGEERTGNSQSWHSF